MTIDDQTTEHKGERPRQLQVGLLSFLPLSLHPGEARLLCCSFFVTLAWPWCGTLKGSKPRSTCSPVQPYLRVLNSLAPLGTFLVFPFPRSLLAHHTHTLPLSRSFSLSLLSTSAERWLSYIGHNGVLSGWPSRSCMGEPAAGPVRANKLRHGTDEGGGVSIIEGNVAKKKFRSHQGLMICSALEKKRARCK